VRKSPEMECEAVKDAAESMAVAARTAPKGRGIDNIEAILIEDRSDRDKLITKMKELSASLGKPSMERDAGSIKDSPEILVIGVRSNPAGLDCDFCGHKTCKELIETKGVCALNSMDLGIAVGSAVSAAARLHVDNRIMYSIGKAAMDLGWFSEKVSQALGIPLSVTGKSPYFDRK
jgi:uncharacterized ferredoxin-like protein